MSKQRNLIALVAVVAIIDGVRTTIAPGEPVTGLHKHDEDALIACGSLEDRTAMAEDAKADAKAQAAADAEFQAAREAVMARAETIAAPAAEAAAPAPTPAPAVTGKKK